MWFQYLVQFNEIYDALPGQLGNENKRFVMNALKEDARYESFANDFAWLTQSDAALKATCAALLSSCRIGAEWGESAWGQWGCATTRGIM